MTKKDTKRGNVSTIKVDVPTNVKKIALDRAEREQRTLTAIVIRALEDYFQKPYGE